MRSKTTLATMALLLGTALPALAAPPFGSFGGKAGPGNAAAGLLPLVGWALDDNGVQRVDVLVDGVVAGQAHYGRSRPGVTQQFPGFPDSPAPGFAFQLDTTRYLNGLHTVTARVRSTTGELATLSPRTFEFLNTTHNLKPFGRIEFPQAGAELRGNCNADPNRRFSVISGYALDLGLDENDTGVNYVELLLDRVVILHNKLDCFVDPALGGEVNCYGKRRQDLVRFYPSLKDDPHVGFRFLLDVGEVIAGGVVPGSHVLTVRAGDHDDQFANIAEIPVHLSCDDPVDNELSLGVISSPGPFHPQAGTVLFTGWALDWQGVLDVAFLVDGNLIGLATYGLPRPAEELDELFVGYPNAAFPGWTIPVDTTLISNGEHFAEIRVRDILGAETYVGRRRFVVANP
jgi:N-acetylmuramoyl-L-alanine amidase